MFVIGDRHILHFLPALEAAANKAGESMAVAGLGSCGPLLGVHIPEESGVRTT